MRDSRQKTQVESVTSLFANPLEQNETQSDIEFLLDHEEEALEWIKNQGEYMGVHTGYPSIDGLLGSFLPGEVLTIGGDTGHGKSILAMNIAQNVYARTSQPVLFINLELTVEQAVQRFYNISGADHDYAGIMVQKSVDVNYKDVDRLISKAKEENVALVVVDHLHFFDESMGTDSQGAITRIMKSFKQSAIKHEMPVIILAHVTPQTVISDGKIKVLKPDTHSLRGSKSIQQISDMVAFVYRDSENPTEVEFYVRKMRSRQLFPESIKLKQNGWKLEE